MKLKDLLEPMEYKTRVGPGGKSLAYITARQAQDRLDEVCGIENWKVEYKELRGELFAGVSIKVSDEWVTKWDGGSESNIEKEKGAISDSFKRACVVWGLGRFLYNIKPTNIGTTPKKDDKPKVWYNDTKKHIDAWEDMVAEGKTTGKEILAKVTANGVCINGKDKETILALDK